MPRLLLPILPILAFAFALRPCAAAQMFTYDLDSLCFMSDTVVEAQIVRHHQKGQQEWKDTFTVIVLDTVSGNSRPGNKIGVDLGGYIPAKTGQHCFLFLSRSDAGSHTTSPYVVSSGMLLIDAQGRVRRYFQEENPGLYIADGTSPFAVTFSVAGVQGADVENPHWPTVAEERRRIADSLARAEQIRPLLSRPARRSDVPALLALLQTRRSLRLDRQRLSDDIAETACRNLVQLKDPAVILDALALRLDWQQNFILTTSVDLEKDVRYVTATLRDPRAPIARRIGAADVINENFNSHDPTPAWRAAVQAESALALAPDTPEPLRMSVLFTVNLKQPRLARQMSRLYHQTHSPELQYAIENAFDDTLGDRGYFSLRPESGPVISIVQPSDQLSSKPNSLALHSAIDRTKRTEGKELARVFLFTNLSTGKSYRVNLGDSNDYGNEQEDQQVPRPKSAPPGRYRVALEFHSKGRVISVGHGTLVTLP